MFQFINEYYISARKFVKEASKSKTSRLIKIMRVVRQELEEREVPLDLSKYPLLLEQSGEQKLKEALECIESRNLESALDLMQKLNTAEPKDLE